MYARIFVVLAFLGISLILWWPALQQPDETFDDFEQELLPEFTAKFLHQEMFDDKGELTQEVFSQKMEHFAELQLTHFVQPEFVIYQDRQPLWRLSAKIGNMQDGLLSLDENVKMVQLNDNNLVKTIATDYIEIDLDTKMVTTDNPITIEGQKMRVVGNGMVADLTLGKVSLTQHVETLIKGKSE